MRGIAAAFTMDDKSKMAGGTAPLASPITMRGPPRGGAGMQARAAHSGTMARAKAGAARSGSGRGGAEAVAARDDLLAELHWPGWPVRVREGKRGPRQYGHFRWYIPPIRVFPHYVLTAYGWNGIGVKKN